MTVSSAGANEEREIQLTYLCFFFTLMGEIYDQFRICYSVSDKNIDFVH